VNKYIKDIDKQNVINLRMVQRKATNKFYFLFILVSILLPVGLLCLYDKFAGGILNGFMGSGYKQGIVDGSLLVTIVNPLVMLSFYGLLVYSFRNTMLNKSRARIEAVVITFLFSIATIITILVVFWGALTT
jgi:hypothetical protein